MEPTIAELDRALAEYIATGQGFYGTSNIAAIHNAFKIGYKRAWTASPAASVVPEGWKLVPVERLTRIFDALDGHLGDTDLDYYESDEELREYEPVTWACKEISLLIADSAALSPHHQSSREK